MNNANIAPIDIAKVKTNTPCILVEQDGRKLIIPVQLANNFFPAEALPDGILESSEGISVDIEDLQIKGNTPIAIVNFNGEELTIPIMSSISVMKGGLAMCGRNRSGQLGLGDYVNRDTITQVGDNKWKFVASSPGYSAAIDEFGYLWDCGDMAISTGYGEPNPTLKRVSGINWKSVACCETHNMAIDTAGKLYAWGYNHNGILGVGSEDMFVRTPTIVPGLGWSSVAVSSQHTWGIDVAGYLYAWGNNSSGLLGLGDSTDRKTPTQIGSKYWSMVSAADFHCMAIDYAGKLYAWGNNTTGLLGISGSSANTPTPINSSKQWGYVSTAAGNKYTFTLAIDKDGYLWGWGDNSCGQLGLGDNTTRTTPTKIGDKLWSMVSAAGSSDSGYCHALAIDRDGYLWGWGDNSFGQLGWGKTRNSPQQIGKQKWTSVSTSTFHSVFIR